MERKAGEICEFVFQRWHDMTLTDYAHVLLAVVLVGWFVTRFCSD